MTLDGSIGGGSSSRTTINFMYGTADVATASNVGSVGHSARDDGEKATQAFECGAKFCPPMS